MIYFREIGDIVKKKKQNKEATNTCCWLFIYAKPSQPFEIHTNMGIQWFM